MPDQKVIVKSAFKIVVLFLGFAMFIAFLSEYSRFPSSHDYSFLIGTFVFGCLGVFFGARKTRESEADETVLANGLQRFTNYFVDLVLCNIIVVTIITSFLDFFARLAQTYSPASVSFVLGIIVLPCYYFLFESLFQRTPAKFLTGTIVTTADLTKPDTLAILSRSFTRLVPFEPLSIFSKKGLWHDNWSRTHVILK